MVLVLCRSGLHSIFMEWSPFVVTELPISFFPFEFMAVPWMAFIKVSGEWHVTKMDDRRLEVIVDHSIQDKCQASVYF